MPASEQYWRSLPQTHKVFAASAIVLLGATLLMMYKDESRSWKKYQLQGEKYRLEKIQEGLEKFDNDKYQAEVSSLQENVDKLQAVWESQSGDVAGLQRELLLLEGQTQILKTKSKSKNAYRDKARADYDLAIEAQASADSLAEKLEGFKSNRLAAEETALEYEQALLKYESLKSVIDSKRSKLDAAKEELAQAQTAQTALQEQKESLKPDKALFAVKRWIKQLPIINGFDPILKIQYDWPRGLEEEIGMVSVGRVDRCRTCHMNIDDFSVVRENGKVATLGQTFKSGDYPEPFCSHPNPEVYLTSTSPHPVNDFGCTVCHGGDGSGTSFQNAEHTPSDPALAKVWAEENDWHSNHFWEHPMFPKQFLESTCLKCHHNVVELGINEQYGATAPKLFKGWETIRDYGCFGCHEVNGFDGIVSIGPDLRLEPNSPEELAVIEADPNMIPGTMRKVGPSLRHIGSKVTPEFVAYWTEEPKRFRPTTKMPQFFDLTNQHDAMAQLLQPVEITAIAKYLAAKSEKLEYIKPQDGYEANVKRGEELFSKRGCLACHSKEGEAFAGIDAQFGPDLSRVHEKVKPGEDGFLWMYTWVKEPSRYHTRTKMPDLYLKPYTEGETYIDPAADIAAFLLQGGPKDFPALTEAKPNLGLVLDHHFTEEKAATLGLTGDDFRGVLVTEVVQGSPASRALTMIGEKWELTPLLPGDIVVSLKGSALQSADQLQEFEEEAVVGDEVDLTVLRNGSELSVRLVVATPADDLVRLFLGKALNASDLEKALAAKRYPVTAEMYASDNNLSDFIKGDEIELAPVSFEEELSAAEWEKRKLIYLGRRTISRYGCYGCHDIPGFEDARPIGTALQDWGRKDTSKLAFEHIHEFLHHHGEMSDEPEEHAGHAEHGHNDNGHAHAALGSSTAARLEKVIKDYEGGDQDVSEQDLTEAMLYQSVITHGRSGFLWQKLRQPRSYDFKKIETKGWDERLRMPKFPLDHEQIEAVSTFVLGLVAHPPSSEFQFTPDKSQYAIFNGEKILAKYNCAGCHVLDMNEVEFEYDPKVLAMKGQEIPEMYKPAFDLLSHIKPIGAGGQGRTGEVTEDGAVVYRAKGFIQGIPDPDEEDSEYRFYSYRFWDGFQLEDGKYIMPSEALQIAEGQIREFHDNRGGAFGEWLVSKLAPELSKTPGGTDFNAAWQASVPPLTGEGHKVQTPWLYKFLKNPEPIRRTTVLRMPRFNMTDLEAQTLANYFAAKDGVAFPYQLIPQSQQEYQVVKTDEYHEQYPDAENDYLTASWYVLNGPLCRKCHNVGGNVVNDPKQVKGPNLQRAEERLRPEWSQLWVYKPNWVYPYTAMPENFPPDKPAEMKKLFDGKSPRQAQAVIDALFNYSKLIDVHGETTYNPAGATPAAGAAAGGAE